MFVENEYVEIEQRIRSKRRRELFIGLAAAIIALLVAMLI